MGIQLSESARRLVDGRNYAVLATVNADGSPQTSVVWVGRDGGDLLFSTVEGRVKHRNMVRDPRVSVSIIDSADGSTRSSPGSTTAGIPARTGPARSAWWCGWRWRRPPVTVPELRCLSAPGLELAAVLGDAQAVRGNEGDVGACDARHVPAVPRRRQQPGRRLA